MIFELNIKFYISFLIYASSISFDNEDGNFADAEQIIATPFKNCNKYFVCRY